MVIKRWEILGVPSLKALEVSLTHQDTINGPRLHLVSFKIGHPPELEGHADSVHVYINSMRRVEFNHFDKWYLKGLVGLDCSVCLMSALKIQRKDMNEKSWAWSSEPQFHFTACYDCEKRVGSIELTI